ncbi:MULTISPECIES: DUF1707 SHOCT-like domain-containing protein [unclassified Streptomyces]|uniref:DUF1707 SHOCT-like domain-containing protein n=1 Tax=unclassified Streptomyces TaxID=2593676 RepID=UPI0022B68BFD|nr:MULTISPECIES: DUF1707 domain-containing protein [unclassified Streptomyces]MCZ7416752.1 DUF1707 domain-containing protein [Streptomyces sp. WMMC897]MCZ7433438.1 DUF1707 domain-containing protein [Streptomyces sp. WMMC1477]
MDDAALSKRATAGAAPAAPARPAPESPVRASDAERDRTAALLGEALAEGRITAEEHAERVGEAYEARTREALRRLLADLPAGRPHAAHVSYPARPVPPSHMPHVPHVTRWARGLPGPPHSALGRALVAVFSAVVRRGRWRVGRGLHAYAVFGSVELDLTEAVFERQEVVVAAFALFGSVEITVPENITVRDAGSGVMGAFEIEPLVAEDPRAPVVVVRGLAVCGAVQAAAKRGRRIRDLRSSGD